MVWFWISLLPFCVYNLGLFGLGLDFIVWFYYLETTFSFPWFFLGSIFISMFLHQITYGFYWPDWILPFQTNNVCGPVLFVMEDQDLRKCWRKLHNIFLMTIMLLWLLMKNQSWQGSILSVIFYRQTLQLYRVHMTRKNVIDGKKYFV